METINDIVEELRSGEFAPLAARIEAAHKREQEDAIAATVVAAAKSASEVYEPHIKSARLGYAAGKQSVTDCNQKEIVDLESRCIYGTVKDVEPVGNAAKMRESAKATMKFIESAIVNGKVSVEALTTLQNIVSKALSAPPRNCDKYLTPKDAMLAHLDEVYQGEKVEFGDYEWCEFIKWLFAEAKGKAK